MSKMPHASPYSGRIAENCLALVDDAVPMPAVEVQYRRREGWLMHDLFAARTYQTCPDARWALDRYDPTLRVVST